MQGRVAKSGLKINPQMTQMFGLWWRHLRHLRMNVTPVTFARPFATHRDDLPSSKLSLAALLVHWIAAPSFAVTFIVPSDRFEIERASAIVIGRVLSSHAERSRFGIETVTNIALEEAIKGNPGNVLQIHEPGGVLDGVVRLVPGAPAFADGERVLLLLYQREDGAYTVSDLGLGAFHLVRELALRDESEIEGWDVHGTPYEEPQRSAQRFLDYVRGIARGEAVAEDYVVAKMSLKVTSETVHAAAFTASSYLLQYGSGLGTRWNGFPSAVSWNQGNSETGQLGSGTAEIMAALSTWNAGGTNYVLSSASANANGFLDATDGTNNIVFEKNLTSAGLQPFNCSSGGALGIAGMTRANFGAGAHVFHGETFGSTIEADVSMNQGLGACTKNQLPPELFKSGVVHELGHTLGFRHSDQNRTLTASCAGDPTLDCSSSAIMNHFLPAGLNGQLQPWDNAALAAVYGSAPACTPPSIAVQPNGAAILGGNSAQLSVSANGTAPLSYQWFAGASGDVSTPVSNGTAATIVVAPSTTTSYWVRVTGPCGPVANSNAAIVMVEVCVPPQILSTLSDQTVIAGTVVTLNLAFTGTNASVTWFANGNPIAFGPLFISSPLMQTTQFRARVTNACGAADSNVATITVTSPRRRTVLH
jgi:hypothetical protein